MAVRLPTRAASLALVAAAIGCAPDAPIPTAPVARSASLSAPAGLASLEWQARARDLVSGARLSALAAARVYAALSVAQHRAIASLEGDAVHAGMNDDGYGAGGRSRYEARRGAVAGSSARVLAALFPSAAAALGTLVADQGEAGPGSVHPQFARGADVGDSIGGLMVAHLASDGFTTPWTGTVPTGAGMWIPNSLPPAGGTFGGVRPYYMSSGAHFRPAPPPAFGTADFEIALLEVVAMTAHLTPAQLQIARKWDYSAGTPTPPGYWNEVASGFIAEANLDERAATEVLAVTQAATMDALVGCWDAKYHYWTLRPWQANGAIPLAIGRPNHPSYPSGHSCGSAAAAVVLGHYFPEHAADLDAKVEEAGLSRILAGIHFRFDITAGQEIGRKVAELALERGAP